MYAVEPSASSRSAAPSSSRRFRTDKSLVRKRPSKAASSAYDPFMESMMSAACDNPRFMASMVEAMAKSFGSGASTTSRTAEAHSASEDRDPELAGAEDQEDGNASKGRAHTISTSAPSPPCEISHEKSEVEDLKRRMQETEERLSALTQSQTASTSSSSHQSDVASDRNQQIYDTFLQTALRELHDAHIPPSLIGEALDRFSREMPFVSSGMDIHTAKEHSEKLASEYASKMPFEIFIASLTNPRAGLQYAKDEYTAFENDRRCGQYNAGYGASGA